MNTVENYFNHFAGHLLEIIIFIEKSFGNGDYLKMKNQGIIPHRNYGLKNSTITGYSFHGNGCGFQFKNYEIDIEFENESIGFSHWSFYLYLKERISEVTEIESANFLAEMVNQGKLNFNGNIFLLPPAGVRSVSE